MAALDPRIAAADYNAASKAKAKEGQVGQSSQSVKSVDFSAHSINCRARGDRGSGARRGIKVPRTHFSDGMVVGHEHDIGCWRGHAVRVIMSPPTSFLTRRPNAGPEPVT